jgi:hypothetical protein
VTSKTRIRTLAPTLAQTCAKDLQIIQIIRIMDQALYTPTSKPLINLGWETKTSTCNRHIGETHRIQHLKLIAALALCSPNFSTSSFSKTVKQGTIKQSSLSDFQMETEPTLSSFLVYGFPFCSNRVSTMIRSSYSVLKS